MAGKCSAPCSNQCNLVIHRKSTNRWQRSRDGSKSLLWCTVIGWAQRFTVRLNLFCSTCTPQNTGQVTCTAAAGSDNPPFSISFPQNTACFIWFKIYFPWKFLLKISQGFEQHFWSWSNKFLHGEVRMKGQGNSSCSQFLVLSFWAANL